MRGYVNYARLYHWHGECHTLRRWSQILGVPEGTLRNRNWNGLHGDELFAPVLHVHYQSSGVVRKRQLKQVIQNRRTAGIGTIHLEIELHYLNRALQAKGRGQRA